jgi:immunity protein 49 of polymorphic toxin system
MGTVERHDLDRQHAERAVARLTARLHEAREDIETDRRGPGFALERSYLEFAERCVADGRGAENDTWSAMVRALQAGAALFSLATRPQGEQVEFHYGDDLIRRPATGPTVDSGPAEWLQAMYLAIVARDPARIDLLASVPVGLLRACAPRQNEYLFAWVRALQAFVRGEAGVVESVLAAMRGTENLTPSTVPELVTAIDLPPMAAFYEFTQGDQAKFTESLTTSLDLHKRNWTTEPRSSTGVVALAPLAVACLARDAGMLIEVESDYLPRDLLVGARAGQWRRSPAAQPMQRPVRTVVARHDLDQQHAEGSVAELTARKDEARAAIETQALGPGLVMRLSFDEFGHRCVADGRAAENRTWLAMVRALQAGAALFLTATRPTGDPVEFRYDDEIIHRPATGPTRDCTALAWLQTMYLAIVARDRPRIDLLAGVPVDLLRADDDFLVAWVRALQVFARGEQGLVEAVLEAMRGTEHAPAKSVGALMFPPMELFYRYTQRDYVAFPKSLRAALDLHKRYWADEPQSPASAVALGPLAMVCLARDAGLPIDVESAYLPHHLLVGSRVGELTT